jgi:hypothetical protein
MWSAFVLLGLAAAGWSQTNLKCSRYALFGTVHSTDSHTLVLDRHLKRAPSVLLSLGVSDATRLARLTLADTDALAVGETVLLIGDAPRHDFEPRLAIVGADANVDTLRAAMYGFYRWRAEAGLNPLFGEHRAIGVVTALNPVVVRLGRFHCTIDPSALLTVARLQSATPADLSPGAGLSVLTARLDSGALGAGVVVISGL